MSGSPAQNLDDGALKVLENLRQEVYDAQTDMMKWKTLYKKERKAQRAGPPSETDGMSILSESRGHELELLRAASAESVRRQDLMMQELMSANSRISGIEQVVQKSLSESDGSSRQLEELWEFVRSQDDAAQENMAAEMAAQEHMAAEMAAQERHMAAEMADLKKSLGVSHQLHQENFDRLQASISGLLEQLMAQASVAQPTSPQPVTKPSPRAGQTFQHLPSPQSEAAQNDNWLLKQMLASGQSPAHSSSFELHNKDAPSGAWQHAQPSAHGTDSSRLSTSAVPGSPLHTKGSSNTGLFHSLGLNYH
eukprot:TRINITY_DN7456_c0_g1_i7.p1 TRINITY_DN7456_c0_g1~~TRINITY_DN7456_c0_g1_i7.p1  ORF type:complete len:308 (+),score=63.85 TRINITY_DN7456_c0_g1_i7:208-1131(+)